MPWINGVLNKLPAAATAHREPKLDPLEGLGHYNVTGSYDAGTDTWSLRFDLQDEIVEVDYDGNTKPNPGSVRGSVRRNPKG